MLPTLRSLRRFAKGVFCGVVKPLHKTHPLRSAEGSGTRIRADLYPGHRRCDDDVATHLFRYFASKEEVVVGPLRTVLNDGISFLRSRPSTESPHAALRATFVYMAGLYQEQRTGFLFRYQVAMQTPSIVSVYLYALIEAELAIGDVLCAHLKTATNRDEIRFLVAIYMTALRVALMIWFERGAPGDVVSLFREHPGYLSSFPQNA